MKTRFVRLFIAALGLALIAMLIVQQIGTGFQSEGRQSGNLVSQQGQVSREDDLNKAFKPASFETIFETDNMLLISGIAEPDTVISILDADKSLRQFKVNANGAWSTEIAVMPNEVMELTLNMFLESGTKIMSDETVYRVPLPIMAADQIEITAPPALLLITSPGGASRIVQSPFGALPSLGPLTLGPIDYDDLGGVIFSGRSNVSGRVRVYVDGNAIGDTRVASDGRWYYIRADTLAVGEYEISAELTPVEGTPVIITVPFERLSPTYAKSRDESLVKFEQTRWQLRRGLRGGGGQYTVILSPKSILSPAVSEDIEDETTNIGAPETE